MTVEWREVKSNPDYIVSSDGQIGSRKFGKFRMLKPVRGSSGYMHVKLSAASARRTVNVHILVAEAFLGPKPTPRHEVNHRSGIKIDNHDHNLEWVTASENRIHRYDVLGSKAAHGEKVGSAKLTEANVREIRARRAAGETCNAIAADYGIRHQHVSRLAIGQRWAWLSQGGSQ